LAIDDRLIATRGEGVWCNLAAEIAVDAGGIHEEISGNVLRLAQLQESHIFLYYSVRWKSEPERRGNWKVEKVMRGKS
jgi:hypothetical protein